MTAVIEVENLIKRYGDFIAVDQVSFLVNQGEIFALLGPNGAGKTSTIRVLMGILFPDEGRIRVLGKEPHEVRAQVGYLPESRGLYRDARLLELLTYLGTLKGLQSQEARKRASAWLQRLGLDEWKTKKVHELSHGMQQKAQIIVALLHEPDVVVLDEPFQGLDPVNIQLVKELVAELREQGKTVLLSSHQLVHVEALANHIALINQGRVIAYGTLQALKQRFARGEIAVALANNAPLPKDLPIAEAHKKEDGWILLPQEGVRPQDFLKQLVAAGAEVEKFEVVYPTLEEIFLRAVEETRN